MQKTIAVFSSFEEAEKTDREFYRRLSGEQRPGILLELTKPDQVVQLGRAPHRIDLLTGLSGVGLDEVFQTKIATQLDNLPVLVLSKELLIRNKRAVGRPQDLADLTELERAGS